MLTTNLEVTRVHLKGQKNARLLVKQQRMVYGFRKTWELSFNYIYKHLKKKLTIPTFFVQNYNITRSTFCLDYLYKKIFV